MPSRWRSLCWLSKSTAEGGWYVMGGSEGQGEGGRQEGREEGRGGEGRKEVVWERGREGGRWRREGGRKEGWK